MAMIAVFLLTSAHLAIAGYLEMAHLSQRRLTRIESATLVHLFVHWFLFAAICAAAHKGAAYVARWLCIVFAASTALLFVQYAQNKVDGRHVPLGAARLALLFVSNIVMRGLEANIWRMRRNGRSYTRMTDVHQVTLPNVVSREFSVASAEMGVPLNGNVITCTSESIDDAETEPMAYHDVSLNSDDTTRRSGKSKRT